MKNKIKILFYGDAPTVATGFGTVTRNILDGLHKTGKYDISVLGVNYWGDPHEFPYPIWPIGVGSRDPYGRQRSFDMMQRDFDFDVLFLFQDSFILQSFMGEGLPRLRQMKDFVTVGYYPIDGVPKREWVECMNMFDVPVTYTEFARKESILAVPDIAHKLEVVPHGVNMRDFYPLDEKETAHFRNSYFGRHAKKFIITNVNRNQQRKDIPRTMLAFKEFKRQRPDSLLYLHMAAVDQGWNLPEVAKGMGLRIGEDVVLPGGGFGPNQGYPIDVVNRIYNASDVIMSTTVGEGWGLSTVEAMACKKPLIFPNNTAITEIIGAKEERGYLVDSGARLTDHVVLPNDNEVVRPLADLNQLVEKLIEVHDNREAAAVKAQAAYDWVKSTLVWEEHIVPIWDKLITDAMGRWAKKKMTAGTPRIVSAEEL
jgi:glycosyltransferase involved in cell wall biosynthesis